MIPKSGVRFSDKIMRRKGGEAPKGACQPFPRSTNKRRRLLIHRRQVYAVCATHLLRGSAPFRGALAFRRSAAALARANASAIGSAPVPAFPETRPGGRYPLRPVTSLPRSAETGRSAGRAVTQSRPGADRIHPRAGTALARAFRKCPRERRPSMSEICRM